MGDEIPVAATLERLMKEDVDRHEAIHCIGEALAHYLYNLQNGNGSPEELNERYYKDLEALSIKEWRERHSQD